MFKIHFLHLHAPLLLFMAVSIPFSAAHACINGYFYGIQKIKVPAFSQVVEQVIRMGAVFLIAAITLETGKPLTVELVVTSHLIGEIASAFYTVLCFSLFPPKEGDTSSMHIIKNFTENAAPMTILAMPLMGNRLVLNVLASAEAIWIPNSLGSYGMSSSEASSIYGVLTGMRFRLVSR